LNFRPTLGTEMIATGKVSVYVERGRYQLYVNELRPLGQGALELAFRQLRAKLEAEGLFDADRKRPIPLFPRRVLIVTSRQTAALQDMLKVLRRFSWLRLSIFHVPVQGAAAGREIAQALRAISSSLPDDAADVILLGRGGGSLEDLWCFNDEAVARAVAASKFPIITGIGHEVDTSIADLVADYHAHTPTEAAQIVVREWRQAPAWIVDHQRKLFRAARRMLDDAQLRLRHAQNHEHFRRPMSLVELRRQRVDDLGRDLTLRLNGRLRGLTNWVSAAGARVARLHPSFALARQRARLADAERRLQSTGQSQLNDAAATLNRLSARLESNHPRHDIQLASQRLSELESRLARSATELLRRQTDRLTALAGQLFVVGPDRVLRRGFTLTIRKEDGKILRSVTEVQPNQRIITRFADGDVEWTAEDPREPKLFS
jgi:exodeoxyribonuclease VII large subunit